MKPAIFNISLSFFLWAAIFYPIYPALLYNWLESANADNSYGMLVPFISLYFIWKKKADLKKVRFIDSSSTPVLLIGSLLFYLLSYAGGIVVLQRMMMVLSLNGMVLYLFGKETYKILLFPLLFLFFMIPIPDSIINIISFPLQTYATIISAKIIQWFGIPVFREGHMLYFVQTQLEVAAACSGIQSISALLMLSVIFMHQCENNRLFNSLLILSSVLIAFLANILRVAGTGILAHFFGAVVARGFLHEFSGVVVFLFGFLMLFGFYSFLNRRWFKG